MRAFIALSFALLAVAYWLASGGPGFVPEARPEAEPAADVTVTRAEPPEFDLVAPPPEAGALTREPEPAALAEAAAPVGPEGLPETPVAPDEALAALAPDLAPDLAAGDAAGDAPGEAPGELVEAAAPGGAGREVSGDRVNLREGPGTSFDVVGRLDRGARAEVIELRDGWAWVRVGDAEGWMSERFLAP